MTTPAQRTRGVAAPVRIGAAVAGAASLALLAGCSATAADATTATPGSQTSGSDATGQSSTSQTSTGQAAGSYRDGSYKETGTYQTPGGQESVVVGLTLKSGKVTAVTVTGSGSNPNTKQYQSAFESGVAAQVVGKPIATLKVGAISGSSLTPNGFNAAVAKIRQDAKA